MPAKVTNAASGPTPTPAPSQTPILIQDTFARSNDVTNGWGTSSDGQAMWHIISHKQAFSVMAATGGGQIATDVNQQNATAYTATLGPTLQDGEVLATFTVQGFDQHSNMGVILRWKNGDFYKAYIDGANFVVMKSVNGQQSDLLSSPFQAQGNVGYTIRFRAVGSTLMARVWESDKQEPGAWTLQVESGGELSSGQAGVRTVLGAANLVGVTAFQVRSL
jgi:hypothetical protein